MVRPYSKGGDDFSASAKIAAKIGLDKKVGYGLETNIAVLVAFELNIDNPPFKAGGLSGTSTRPTLNILLLRILRGCV